MKTLNQYIKESILDDEEDIIRSAHEVLIRDFIQENYKITGELDIKKSNNKYIVDCGGHVVVSNKKIETITNNLFEWGEIKKYFDCCECMLLESLQGAPKKVGGDFYCRDCMSLKSLDGAPKEVGGSFICHNCKSLKDLTGAPKEVEEVFYCRYCDSLKSLEGAPKKVGSDFSCSNCKSLTTLKGAPKEVGGDFNCCNCGTKFTKEDVEKVSKVKENIVA